MKGENLGFNFGKYKLCIDFFPHENRILYHPYHTVFCVCVRVCVCTGAQACRYFGWNIEQQLLVVRGEL